MKTGCIIMVILLLKNGVLLARVRGRNMHQSISLKSSFIQIRDEFNYGLVHNGLDLAGNCTPR